MGTALAGVHLGTNSDVFVTGTKNFLGQITASEFWIRYTLDATSEYLFDWPNAYGGADEPNGFANHLPLSGSLWFSFNATTKAFNMYDDLLAGPDIFELGQYNRAVQHYGDPSSFSTYAGYNSNLYMLKSPCLECDIDNWLGLSFLEFRKIGAQYELYTSAQGFDQIFKSVERCLICGWTATTTLNLAPVPLPTTAWLFGSGLLGLATARRARRTA